MHPVTLMLVKSIERERYEAIRHPRRPSAPRAPARPAPSRPSLWNEMPRVYRLGFAAKP